MPIPSFADAIKIANTALNAEQAIAMQSYILDLQSKLQEEKDKSFEYQTQILELQRTIDKLQKQIDSASNWEKTKSEYKFDDPLGIWVHAATGKPFCPNCFARKAETPLRVGSGGHYSFWCFPCNKGF